MSFNSIKDYLSLELFEKTVNSGGLSIPSRIIRVKFFKQINYTFCTFNSIKDYPYVQGSHNESVAELSFNSIKDYHVLMSGTMPSEKYLTFNSIKDYLNDSPLLNENRNDLSIPSRIIIF